MCFMCINALNWSDWFGLIVLGSQEPVYTTLCVKAVFPSLFQQEIFWTAQHRVLVWSCDLAEDLCSCCEEHENMKWLFCDGLRWKSGVCDESVS